MTTSWHTPLLGHHQPHLCVCMSLHVRDYGCMHLSAHIVAQSPVASTEKGLHLYERLIPQKPFPGIISDLPCCFHTVTPAMSLCMFPKKYVCICHMSSSPTLSARFPHG